jgi:hypothetical protein
MLLDFLYYANLFLCVYPLGYLLIIIMFSLCVPTALVVCSSFDRNGLHT